MFMALRFAHNGELYGANTSALYRINRITGRAEKVVEFSDDVKGNVMGLAIDSDGNFYLADYSADSHGLGTRYPYGFGRFHLGYQDCLRSQHRVQGSVLANAARDSLVLGTN